MSSLHVYCPTAKWLIESGLHIPHPQEIFTVLHVSCFPPNHKYLLLATVTGNTRVISMQERSGTHLVCILYHRATIATVDTNLMKQIDGEKQYWREVLRRDVSVIKSLGEKGLTFREHDKLLGSAHSGNYLGILELL